MSAEHQPLRNSENDDLPPTTARETPGSRWPWIALGICLGLTGILPAYNRAAGSGAEQSCGGFPSVRPERVRHTPDQHVTNVLVTGGLITFVPTT